MISGCRPTRVPVRSEEHSEAPTRPVLGVSTCAICLDARRMAELRAYLDAPGIVLRCASCGAAQLRLVRATDRAWLDLQGMQVLEIHGATSAA